MATRTRKMSPVQRQAAFLLSTVLPNNEVGKIFGVTGGYISLLRTGRVRLENQDELLKINDKIVNYYDGPDLTTAKKRAG